MIAPNSSTSWASTETRSRFTEGENDQRRRRSRRQRSGGEKVLPGGKPNGQEVSIEPGDTGQLEWLASSMTQSTEPRDPPPPTISCRSARHEWERRPSRSGPAADRPSRRRRFETISGGNDPNLPLVRISTQIDLVEKRARSGKLFRHGVSFFGGLGFVACGDRSIRFDVV